MPNPGKELSSIDFESMIGGPLSAVVNAQAQSAMTTVNFIKEVGFKKAANHGDQDMESPETGDPIYVKFKYPKELVPFQPAEYDEDGNQTKAPTPAQYERQVLEVPILTILPIPYIRVDEATVEFNAKINSMSYQRTSSSFKVAADLQVKHSWLVGSAKLNVSTSYQRNTTQGSNVKRTYSMRVFVKAVQDEMPGGMEKMLGILEDAIRSTPRDASG
mgnify:CR=1 FL=1